MIKLAGPVAQQRYSSRSRRNDHASMDWLEAFDIARRLIDNERETIAYIAWLEYRTTDVIEQQWKDVKRVAGALLRQDTLSGAELQKTLMPV
jgi:hypothetical protein